MRRGLREADDILEQGHPVWLGGSDAPVERLRLR